MNTEEQFEQQPSDQHFSPQGEEEDRDGNEVVDEGYDHQEQHFDESDGFDTPHIKAGQENLASNPIDTDLELKKKIVLYYHELVSCNRFHLFSNSSKHRFPNGSCFCSRLTTTV